MADHFECTLVWMDHEPLLPNRPYKQKIGTRTMGASVKVIEPEVQVKQE